MSDGETQQKKSQYSKVGFSRMDYTCEKSKDIDQVTAVNEHNNEGLLYQVI